jgi:hypothetical protein
VIPRLEQHSRRRQIDPTVLEQRSREANVRAA